MWNADGNSLVTTTSYATNENLVASIANSAVGTYSYGYDANHNRTSETITGTMANYGWSTGIGGYDDEDRLVNWNRSDSNLLHERTLSEVGDWDSVSVNGTPESRIHGPAHELTTVGGQSLTYDVKGNLVSDHLGRSFTWDADNHLASVTVGSGAAVGEDGTHSYAFDALARRVSKTVDDAMSNYTTTVFVSLTVTVPPLGTVGGQILAEYPAGTSATSPDISYVYGSYVDEPLAMIDGSTVRYYHQDARYDVVALSNSSGSVVERAAYDAYGNTLLFDGSGNSITASSIGNRYGFTGREHDPETGLHYFRARYYDGRLGRFVGRDPAGYEDRVNLLAAYFVPNHLDASGMITVDWGYDTTSQCPSTFSLQGAIVALKSRFIGSLPEAVPNYASMPFQHCVWNCRTAGQEGRPSAVELSMEKEQMDGRICKLGASLSDECWSRLSEGLKESIAGSCCSADRPSDWVDNQTGRDCGNCKDDGNNRACETCCQKKGLQPTTPDGPGTNRPCGPYMQDRMNGFLPPNGIYPYDRTRVPSPFRPQPPDPYPFYPPGKKL